MKQAEGFTASKYDPKKWVDLIQESGARYAVITTKHHDGVALWNTKAGDLSVVKSNSCQTRCSGSVCGRKSESMT